MPVDLPELTTQLEYYFSDKNLEYDEFFYNEIEANAERYLKLEIVLNCNKIKKMEAGFEDLQKAVDASELLELDEAREMVRRKDKGLPSFKGFRKRNVTRSSRKNSEAAHNEAEDDEEKSKWFVPVLLVIPDVTDLPKNGKLLEETISAEHGVSCPYGRVNNTNGHVVFDGYATDEADLAKVIKAGFHMNEKHYTLQHADEREKGQFNKENLGYLEKIVKKKFNKMVKKMGKKAEKKLFDALDFNGERYNNFSGLQTAFKNIIAKTKNGGNVDEKSASMLRKLLSYHGNSAEKLKDEDGFTVDFHPVYKQTRCFFIKRKDATSEDFSLHKCLNAFKDTLINPK